MTPRDLGNICNIGNSCRDVLPLSNMALKLLQYFYLLMQKPIGCYFKVQSSYFHMAQYNQKTPIPYPQGESSDLRKPKKVKHQH